MAKPAALRVATAITPALPLREAVRIIILGYLAQLRGAHARANSAAALHALRMALRRIRIALGYLRRQDAEARRIERALAAITRAMGEARDEDVFVATTLPAVLKLAREKSRDLVRAASGKRRLARARLRALLVSASYQAVQHDLAAWLATRTASAVTTPVEKFARKRVRKLHRRLLAHARGLRRQSYAQQHETRKQARRLRYTVENFAGLCTHPKRVERYVRCVKAVQDALGETHDAVQGVAKLEQLRAPALVLALARRHLETTAAANVKKAQRALRQLRHRKNPL